MFRTKNLLILHYLLLYTVWGFGQFKATIEDGDYAPAKSNFAIDQQNKKFKDPPQLYYDSKTQLWHATWTQFDSYKSKSKQDVSVIYYAQWLEGKARNSNKQLNRFNGDCLDGDSTVKGAMPCVGKNGEVYVSWASSKGLAFQRSLDSGKTWLKEEKIINAIQKGWASKVDGIKTNGLPVIACDLSQGEFSGRIYICWSDEKNGEKNKDVFLVYSDDKGDNWTEPILVTYHPNHQEQFKPCMKVDSLTGFVYILYFDKQNYFEGKETDLSLALSKNGGLKFDYFKVNESSFLFNSNFTELNVDHGIKARWVQPDKIKRFVLYSVALNDAAFDEYYLLDAGKEVQMERSVKFAEKLHLEGVFPTNAIIAALITKPLEPGFEKVLLKNKTVFAGKNKLTLDLKAAGIKKGNYILTFYYNGRNSFVWITDE
jgi:hypothetical protein